MVEMYDQLWRIQCVYLVYIFAYQVFYISYVLRYISLFVVLCSLIVQMSIGVFEYSTQLDALSKCPQHSGDEAIIFKFSWESYPEIILKEAE